MRPVANLLAAVALAVALVGCTTSTSGDAVPRDQGESADGGEPTGESAEEQDAADDSVEIMPGEWTPGREADPSTWRTEVGVAAWDGRIWVVGGFVDGSPGKSDTVLIYDPTTDRWDEGPPLPGGVDHAAVVGGDRLYVIGGFGQGENVWILNDVGDGWDPGPALPEQRGAGAAVWDGSRVVYGGGVGEDGRDNDDVLVLEDGQWSDVGQLSLARDHLGAATDGAGHVWFLAGRVTDSFGFSNVTTVDLFDGGQVTHLGDVPTARSGGGGFFVPGIGGCLAGGESSGRTFTEVECIDDDGTVRILPDLPQGRHGIGAGVVLGDHVYVLTGGPEPGFAYSGTVYILDVSLLP